MENIDVPRDVKTSQAEVDEEKKKARVSDKYTELYHDENGNTGFIEFENSTKSKITRIVYWNEIRIRHDVGVIDVPGVLLWIAATREAKYTYNVISCKKDGWPAYCLLCRETGDRLYLLQRSIDAIKDIKTAEDLKFAHSEFKDACQKRIGQLTAKANKTEKEQMPDVPVKQEIKIKDLPNPSEQHIIDFDPHFVGVEGQDGKISSKFCLDCLHKPMCKYRDVVEERIVLKECFETILIFNLVHCKFYSREGK